MSDTGKNKNIVMFPTTKIKDCPFCGGKCSFGDKLNLIICCSKCDMIFSCNNIHKGENHVLQTFNKRQKKEIEK